MDQQHIVVHDPEGEFWEGSLITPTQARALAARGVIALPFDPTLMRMSGVGGYHKRAWGSGWPVGANVPTMHCPLTVFARPGTQAIHWAARIVAEKQLLSRLREGDKLVGQLRLVQDTGQVSTMSVSPAQPTKAVDMRDLPPPDDGDGWFVGGRAQINVPMDGYYGFGIYGAIQGVRVAWAAVSLAAE